MTPRRAPGRPDDDVVRRALLVLALTVCLTLVGARAPAAHALPGAPSPPGPVVGPVVGPVGGSLSLAVGGTPHDAGASPGVATGTLLSPDVDPSDGSVEYDWPTGGAVPVLAPFEGSESRYGPGHRGVDLDVRPGTTIVAAADGVVAFTGQVAGRPVVSIDHADGLRTTYEPVSASVSAGDRVTGGEVVGTLAAGHCPPPGCLHWGARRGSHDYVDPLSLLGDAPQPVRLLPLGR
ncbi:murein hydrolase activator EnvC family protein [Georgenia sp. Z1344]|uniref:murein hydrolase activator EnvC family protein n=1 Tax=Georgenia sp. Z1344 TaxID=3416706 RepID=UPI003CF393E9